MNATCSNINLQQFDLIENGFIFIDSKMIFKEKKDTIYIPYFPLLKVLGLKKLNIRSGVRSESDARQIL